LYAFVNNWMWKVAANTNWILAQCSSAIHACKDQEKF